MDRREMEQTVDAFISTLQILEQKSSATAAGYKSDLHIYSNWCQSGDIDYQTITAADLERFISFRAQSAGTASINRMKSALRAFYQWLVLARDLKHNPAAGLHQSKTPEKLPLWCTAEEVESMADLVDERHSLLDRTILTVLFCSGLRVSELCGLKRSQILWDQNAMQVTGKGNKERRIPLSRSCMQILKEYDGSRTTGNGRGALFFEGPKGQGLNRQYVYRLIKKQAADAGLNPGLSPHSLRHSYATRLIASDADLRSVQKLLGHSDVQTTQIYTHIDYERLKSQYNSAMEQNLLFSGKDEQKEE
jgi:site-specific recombinase XerD